MAEPTIEALQKRVAELEGENAGLKKQVSKYQKQASNFIDVPEEIEEEVQRRMASGLEREQAVRAVKSQMANDARVKAEEEKATAAAKKGK